MEWIKRFDKILDYIELNLTETIDLNEIEKLSYCSNYNFQRIFSFIIDIPLAEYIRNRRLTVAAEELRNSKKSILEIAIKYGYHSQEAFTRAFIKFHGVTPKQARHFDVQLQLYPKANFVYEEEKISMNSHPFHFMLERKPSGEFLKNKAPSPITLNFPVSLWSYMEYMGLNSNTMQTYTLAATLSGDAYNAGLALTEDTDIIETIEAFGFECRIFSTRQADPNYISETSLKELIINELTLKQKPIIMVNMVDCCFGGIIVGYKNYGECLLNWGYFPFDFSDNPEPVITECNEWYKKTQKVVFIGDTSNHNIDLKQLYIKGLKKASNFLGTSENLRTEINYKEWKNRLFETGILLKNDFSIIDPMWCDYAEKRFYAGQFMLQLRAFLPPYEDKLNELWYIFGKTMNGLMLEYISKVNLTPGSECDAIHLEKLKDKKIQHEMYDIVCNCEEEERRAADIIFEICNSI